VQDHAKTLEQVLRLLNVSEFNLKPSDRPSANGQGSAQRGSARDNHQDTKSQRKKRQGNNCKSWLFDLCCLFVSSRLRDSPLPHPYTNADATMFERLTSRHGARERIALVKSRQKPLRSGSIQHMVPVAPV